MTGNGSIMVCMMAVVLFIVVRVAFHLAISFRVLSVQVARYDIRYSQIDGGSSVNLVRVIIEVENINVIIVRRFKCRSRESGAVQYLTVTTSEL